MPITYDTHKQLWKTKYNKTDYCKTRGLRYRKNMIVLEVPEKNIYLKFRSKEDVLKLLKKVNFQFDRDFKDFILPENALNK